jgi:hypothetical protein
VELAGRLPGTGYRHKRGAYLLSAYSAAGRLRFQLPYEGCCRRAGVSLSSRRDESAIAVAMVWIEDVATLDSMQLANSNPRRPAWEIDCRLQIENIASMVSTEGDSKYPVSNGLLQGAR